MEQRLLTKWLLGPDGRSGRRIQCVDEIDAGYDSRAAATEDRSGDTADSGSCCEATQAQCRSDGESDDGQAQRSADSATDSGADDGAEQAADLSAETELTLEVRNRPIILLG